MAASRAWQVAPWRVAHCPQCGPTAPALPKADYSSLNCAFYPLHPAPRLHLGLSVLVSLRPSFAGAFASRQQY